VADGETLFPFEVFIEGVPRAPRAGSAGRWKTAVGDAAQKRRQETYELGFLDDRPVAVTVYYFPDGAMDGDIDNILKPIIDALKGVAYLDDEIVERAVVQKFEPDVSWRFLSPSDRLAAALAMRPPIVYIRVDDDLAWRRL
jgi:hypothetical protein